MRQSRKGVAAAVVALCGATLPGFPSRAADVPRATVTVVVYNYARIPPKTLGDTKRVAARVLRQAGVGTRWRNAPWGEASHAPWEEAARQNHDSADETFGPATLVLRLLPAEMIKPLGFQSNHYGFAQCATDGGFAFAAGVFYPRAERLARGVPSLVPIILGHLMAHEIGHLLLGPNSHSDKGIMSAPWGEPQVQKALQVGLRFTASEANQIRVNAKARIQATNARTATSIANRRAEPEQQLPAIPRGRRLQPLTPATSP